MDDVVVLAPTALEAASVSNVRTGAAPTVAVYGLEQALPAGRIAVVRRAVKTIVAGHRDAHAF